MNNKPKAERKAAKQARRDIIAAAALRTLEWPAAWHGLSNKRNQDAEAMEDFINEERQDDAKDATPDEQEADYDRRMDRLNG